MALTRPILALAAGLALANPAHAAFAPADPFSDTPPLSAEELGAARGGMVVNGISMDFAIVIRSTVEGAVTQGLQTVLTVNDQGGLAAAVTTPIGADTVATLTLPVGTSIIHEVVNGQITALIANTNNGVTLNQSTSVNVDLPGITTQSQVWYSSSRAIQASMEAALRGISR